MTKNQAVAKGGFRRMNAFLVEAGNSADCQVRRRASSVNGRAQQIASRKLEVSISRTVCLPDMADRSRSRRNNNFSQPSTTRSIREWRQQ